MGTSMSGVLNGAISKSEAGLLSTSRGQRDEFSMQKFMIAETSLRLSLLKYST